MSQTNYGTNYDLFDDTMNNTISIGAGGGITYTTNTSSVSQAVTWNGINPIWTTSPATPLKVNGDAEIDGDLKVKGRSLSEAIENIEKRLAILHPNEQLEEKWEELKALGERYRELEKDILEKEKIWKKLQK
jgi:hypothetical protein